MLHAPGVSSSRVEGEKKSEGVMRDGMRERMGAGWKKPPPTVVKTATRKKEKKGREKKRKEWCGAIKEYDGNKSL